MARQKQLTDVSDTSFWVAHYRAKESERPDALFQDRFAEILVGERGKKIAESMPRESRFTDWSVVARTVIIDGFIEKLISEGADALINLGAGLDARPYRMNLSENFQWIEADYPNIVAHKNQKLQNEKPRCRLTRVAVDLADDVQRKTFLSTAGLGAKKVIVLTEGVLPYLTTEQVADLSHDLLNQKRIAYWIAEYMDKKVYKHLKSATRKFKMKNTPFQFFPENWFEFFKSIGWSERETKYIGEVAIETGRPMPLPWPLSIIFPLFPEKIQHESRRMSGFTIFRRTHEI